jgi:hypothetical protein
MAGLRERVRDALGGRADITGWSYRLLAPEVADDGRAALDAVRSTIGDPGNMRMLFIADLTNLDPVADRDAVDVLQHAPSGSRLAYEIAFHLAAPFA